MSWVSKLPVEKIKRKVFDSLPEYSMSTPTGGKPGTVWKRNVGLTNPPTWVICEYVAVSETHSRTEYRKPEVVE